MFARRGLKRDGFCIALTKITPVTIKAQIKYRASGEGKRTKCITTAIQTGINHPRYGESHFHATMPNKAQMVTWGITVSALCAATPRYWATLKSGVISAGDLPP